MLKTLFFIKRLKIISIEKNENTTIVKRIVQANLEDSYCFKLGYILKASYPIKEIDLHQFLNFSIDSKNYIHQFSQL